MISLPGWFSARRQRSTFSMSELLRTNPKLAALFLWRTNRVPEALPDPLWLHIGSGENVIGDFLNIDFIPNDDRVLEWDLLDVWPECWPCRVHGALSEDTLEHFFLSEQLYILCEVNRALNNGATYRVLMPALNRLIEYCSGFEPRDGELLYSTYGVETEADALNVGMRFSGHRWLHDDESFPRLANLAGFEALKTSCAESSEAFLSRRNIRSEEGTAAFAYDLRKRDAIRRVIVRDSEAKGLEHIEVAAPGIQMLRILRDGAELAFRLPQPLPVSSLVCVNVRSANVTSFREHNAKRLVLRSTTGVESHLTLDETLKSKHSLNMAWPSIMRVAMGHVDHAIAEIALLPGATGDLVTAGQLEVFWNADSVRLAGADG